MVWCGVVRQFSVGRSSRLALCDDPLQFKPVGISLRAKRGIRYGGRIELDNGTAALLLGQDDKVELAVLGEML